ncbi:MAG: MBL fold metallo-hydrolase [Deltaproteobacteria bacterium]|nr:MBL fold metallo-hydrolase [Deltaproteobacteria bacterium]
MRIKFLRHAAVEIVAESGLRILTDPHMPGYYHPPGGSLYGEPISESYDIVVVSHEHPDHNAVTAVPGKHEIVRGMELIGKGITTVKGIDFWSVGTYHDDKEGALLGNNAITCFNVDGVKICHSGDIGHVPTAEQIDELNKYGMDIVLLCIGLIEKVGERYEKYVIDSGATTMNGIYEALKPHIKVLIPIHYRYKSCDFRFITLGEFIQGKSDVVYHYLSEMNFNEGFWEKPMPQILVLQPAL